MELKKHPIIEMTNIRKNFKVGGSQIRVLKGITLSIYNNEFVIIVGPSGCGKSTLLHVMLGLEEPTLGDVRLFNVNLYEKASEDDRAVLRRDDIGVIFQQPGWVHSLNVLDNVAFPLWMKGQDKITSEATAFERLETVGMQDYAKRNPLELSSGQQQKISVARALAIHPSIIVADEPTGNLDRASGIELMDLLRKLHSQDKKTIIMVTHAVEYVTYANRVVQMLDGIVVKEYVDGEIKEYQTKINTILHE